MNDIWLNLKSVVQKLSRLEHLQIFEHITTIYDGEEISGYVDHSSSEIVWNPCSVWNGQEVTLYIEEKSDTSKGVERFLLGLEPVQGLVVSDVPDSL